MLFLALGPPLPIKEQIAFLLASPNKHIHCLSTVDLWELGGEFLSIRRKESAKISKHSMDKEEYKRQLVRIEATAESKWKGRLLSILEFPG